MFFLIFIVFILAGTVCVMLPILMPYMFVKGIIREALKLQLCRSIGGWLGKLMNTKIFSISQEKSGGRKAVGLFRRRKQEQGEEGEGQ